MGREPAREAAQAHTDLTLFAAIDAICGNSLFSPDSEEAVRRIRQLCAREQRRCLRAYDDANAAINAEGR